MRPKVRGTCEGSLGLLPPGSDPVRNLAAPRARTVYPAALEPDGRMRWSVELGGDVDSSPILSGDGTIFVGSDDRKMYALRAGISASR